MATSIARAADPDKKLNFALCGLGSLSTNQIAPALQKTKYCRLVGIVTGTPAKAEKWKGQYNIPVKNIYNYDTMHRLVENPDIDVVYVVTPNALHAEHTIEAAKAGKHVLSEKPMEVSVRKCEDMIAACKAAGRKLAVGYRCQFEPHHLECMRLAREKVFGDIKLIEAGFGFRIGDLAYCTDVSKIPRESMQRLEGLEILVLDALRFKPHPAHFSLGQALEVIERVKPRRAYLTHLSHEFDHETVNRQLPPHVQLAYDGLKFEF